MVQWRTRLSARTCRGSFQTGCSAWTVAADGRVERNQPAAFGAACQLKDVFVAGNKCIQRLVSNLEPANRRAQLERKKVNSGSIRAVGYDERSQTLEVEFSSGSVVQYQRVSAEVHRRLLAAPVLASYFRDNIEESYTARKIR